MSQVTGGGLSAGGRVGTAVVCAFTGARIAGQVLGGFRAPVKGEQIGDRGIEGGSGVGGMALSFH